MNLAIASCKDLPEWEQDDQGLFDELSKRNINYQVLPWDSDCDWSEFDICLIRTTWDYQERFPEFSRWIETVSQKTRLLNSSSVIKWNSHKGYLKELEDNAIAIAPSEWLFQGNYYSIQELMTKRGWERGFIKPLIGANARECCRFDNNKEGLTKAQSHIERLLIKEDLVLQPYLKSVEEFGETSGVFFDHEFSHGTRKVPIQGDFRVQDDYGAKDFPYELSLQEKALSKAALDYVRSKYGNLLYARIDFLHDENGIPFLNEMELIEPSLFFRHGAEQSCKLLVDKLVKYSK